MIKVLSFLTGKQRAFDGTHFRRPSMIESKMIKITEMENYLCSEVTVTVFYDYSKLLIG